MALFTKDGFLNGTIRVIDPVLKITDDDVSDRL